MIFAALCFIVIGALAGLVFGGLEGSEVVARRTTGGKKLPHAWLLLARVFVCLFVAVAIEGWTQLSLIGAGISFVALAMIHRLELNHVLGKQFFYMGPVERSGGDSVYDSFMWGVSKWWAFVTREEHRPQSVFTTAVVIEGVALLFLVAVFLGQSA